MRVFERALSKPSKIALCRVRLAPRVFKEQAERSGRPRATTRATDVSKPSKPPICGTPTRPVSTTKPDKPRVPDPRHAVRSRKIHELARERGRALKCRGKSAKGGRELP